jgi:DNA-directed RNA polymerase subunit RPC12/RpoP
MKTIISHKTPVIRCPHCNAEYLPGEIFIPGSLIGQPDEVIRDSFGKIIYEDYFTDDRTPTLEEHFVCEYCEKPFVIEATVTYKTREEAPEKDFSTQYVSLLD